jgi:hypothetical protein
MTERDIINGLLRSVGFSNPQESYNLMMQQTQKQLMDEIKQRELSKAEIDEICKANGLEDSEQAFTVARSIEELVRTKFGIPKV